MAARVTGHWHGQTVPKRVGQLEEQGFRITSIHWIVHCPIPPARHHILIRALMLTLEAVFTCMFWTLPGFTEAYGFPDICDWGRDDYDYSGACTHSSLLEAIPGIKEHRQLSPEEADARQAAIDAKNRRYQCTYQKRLREEASPKYKERQRKNNQKQFAGTKKRQQEAKIQELYKCGVCNVNCRDGSELKRHNSTPRHLARVNRSKGICDRTCYVCDDKFPYPSDLKVHLQKHRRHEKLLDMFLLEFELDSIYSY